MLQINPHVGGRYQFRVTPQYERLDEDFEISDGVVLPAGAVYQFIVMGIRLYLPVGFAVLAAASFWLARKMPDQRR